MLHTIEIKYGSDSERFKFQPAVDNARLDSDPNATITIKTPDGLTTLVDGDSMTWDATSELLYYDIDASATASWLLSDYATYPLDFWYAASIEFTIDGIVYTFDPKFVVVNTPWNCNVTGDDIMTADASTGYNRPDASDWLADIRSAIESVKAQLFWRNPSIPTGLVMNKVALDMYVKYLVLYRYWDSRSAEKDEYAQNNIANHYRKLADEQWANAMSSALIDTDMDAAVDEDTTHVQAVTMRS